MRIDLSGYQLDLDLFTSASVSSSEPPFPTSRAVLAGGSLARTYLAKCRLINLGTHPLGILQSLSRSPESCEAIELRNLRETGNFGGNQKATRKPKSKMVVRIRLARFGRRNKPFYNIVVAQSRYVPGLSFFFLPPLASYNISLSLKGVRMTLHFLPVFRSILANNSIRRI